MELHTLSFERKFNRTVRMNYLLYMPENTGNDTARTWPLLIFLHGRGARGDDPDVIKSFGPPSLIEAGRELPFVVLAPQCPLDTTWPLQTDALNALWDEALAYYPVDPERVYLTGVSMGGYGTWNWAASDPKRFAAIAPICGGGSWLFEFPEKVCALKEVPVWAFHGAKDEVVPIRESEVLVNTLRACGGNVRFTVYPDAAHDSWTETYNNAELYEWFLRHRRVRVKAEPTR